MKKHIITLITLIGLLVAPIIAVSQDAEARTPQALIGIDSNGQIHYTITTEGLPYYSVATYGHCHKHHRTHRCRYVAPPKHKHHKAKHHKAKHHKNHNHKQKRHDH